ncbi:hypothetical protein SBC1_81140 (plasmid) [Caballeronia sp. SBC1]|uniref:hypothetical protein n=1 Tax=Caballeronia sp. SBC1 TaxID=2705548 RepID=UPI00140CC62F|nr:hypothetical protein [Caballeronia sp. SBC1]QIN68067.1 hypothetical protein SBC1_81140 [Caballeronia sp. SBC1]
MKFAKVTLTQEQQSALVAFATSHGRNWKSALRRLWDTGRDEREPNGPLLRQVRNTLGPSCLVRYRVPDQNK